MKLVTDKIWKVHFSYIYFLYSYYISVITDETCYRQDMESSLQLYIFSI